MTTRARGMAPRRHFLHRTTTDKLALDLDVAAEQGLDLLVVQFLGGRDWVLVTHPRPIPGPAGRRVLHPSDEE
ncbi:MAG: hypothetical protein ACRDYV_23135 [Acidimicrobiia bacterium]